jgi:hypothetical protein
MTKIHKWRDIRRSSPEKYDEMLDEARKIPLEEYDPDTCHTAGELREMGFQIPDSIPDCGWIPKYALKMNRFDSDNTVEKDDGKFIFNIQCEITVPFKWVETEIELDHY